MTRIVFIEPGGRRRPLEAVDGLSAMETAKAHGVLGIVALCGGACACATCHVYVEEGWLGRLEPPEELEAGMLELVHERRDNSRLSCQITVTPDLEGMILAVPARQAGV